jgi:hypothetical protein
MSDETAPKFELSPEGEAKIRLTSRKMSDAISRGISAAVDAKVAALQLENEVLRIRVERLERAIALREVDS